MCCITHQEVKVTTKGKKYLQNKWEIRKQLGMINWLTNVNCSFIFIFFFLPPPATVSLAFKQLCRDICEWQAQQLVCTVHLVTHFSGKSVSSLTTSKSVACHLTTVHYTWSRHLHHTLRHFEKVRLDSTAIHCYQSKDWLELAHFLSLSLPPFRA